MYLHESLHILGVDISESEASIKKVFRQKAKKLHPDVNKSRDAAAQFRQLNEAYELILEYKNTRNVKFQKPQSKPYQKPTYSQEYYDAYYKNYDSFYKKWFEQEEQKKAENSKQKKYDFWDSDKGHRLSIKWKGFVKNTSFVIGVILILTFLYYFFIFIYNFLYHLYLPDGSGLAIVLGVILLFFGFILRKAFLLIKTKR